MFAKFFRINCAAILVAAIVACSIGGFSALSHAQGCCGGGHGGSAPAASQPAAAPHDGHGDPSSGGSPNGAAPNAKTAHHDPAPHDGQLTVRKTLVFEVVYLPKEIRVYVYGPYPKPRSARGIEGAIALQPPRDDKHVTRVALKYVAPPTGGHEQDYLSASIDMRGAKDGSLMAAIKLEKLPLAKPSQVEFGQTVVMSHPKPRVVVVELDKSDADGIARQKVCPVTGAELGSMGDPIKVLVDGKPLYLCCRGCLGKVERDPEACLRKASGQKESR